MTKSKLGGSVLELFLVCVALTIRASGQGWVGASIVNRPDSTYDGEPCIAMDSQGLPWVVYYGHKSDTTLLYSQWDGSRWGDERGVGPDAAGAIRLRASFAFDGSDRAWAAWDNAFDNNANEIGSRFWDGVNWSPELRVSQPDSNLYFAPKIAVGGGQVWCVWFGGPTDTSAYRIYASRWDGASGAWMPQMQVSPADGNLHWFPDVAVDSAGTPRAIWCQYPHYLLNYSYYDGHEWIGPMAINDTTRVEESPRDQPKIRIDRDGIMHVSFVGAATGAMHRDVFYTRNDGSGWLEPQMVTHDGIYDEWVSAVAADRPGNVWVVWDRQGESTDQFRIHASHFNGVAWSPEQRLDNDLAYYEGEPRVCLDRRGCAWAVWTGVTYGVDNNDVYTNRYSDSSVALNEVAPTPEGNGVLSAVSPAVGRVPITYALREGGPVRLDIFDGLGRLVRALAWAHQAHGQHQIEWDGRDPKGRVVPSGTYFCRLKTEGFSATGKFVLTASP